MKSSILLLSAVATIPCFAPVAKSRAADATWYPSKWGANDEIGAANLVTPESMLKAVKLVKTGKTFPLGVPIDKSLPAFRHRSFYLTNVQPNEAGGATMGPISLPSTTSLSSAGQASERSLTASATSASTMFITMEIGRRTS